MLHAACQHHAALTSNVYCLNMGFPSTTSTRLENEYLTKQALQAPMQP